ncbi:hypothetical protein PoB_006127400 [Plakobranchus ocellatus]|uniref:Uncharacterized protein n=1 Tax=Plakobranchus ocellatus TaxID=259542 RepID=A0AAV4CSF9_9GAST|nr:hypothetical protein PoB_006127400 [Plakobranchus ocellatus]
MGKRGKRKEGKKWLENWEKERGCECASSPQQGDLRLSGPPSGQGASGGARTRDRRVPADIRADSLATVPSTPLIYISSQTKFSSDKGQVRQ